MISIIIPVYNEEEVLPFFIDRILSIKSHFNDKHVFEWIFIDDGSEDESLEILIRASSNEKDIKIISLSRNWGHQNAVTAGLGHASGDYIVIIDADLQDPPELIPKMYDQITQEKLDVVYGKRNKRQGETIFKKLTASLFYRVLDYFSDLKIPRDTGDFRIITRKVLDQFNLMPEQHRFIRGMIPWIGFKSSPYHYDRDEREHGVTKYPLFKMVQFATNAILSFSSKPIKIATRFGLFIVILGVIFGIYVFFLKMFYGTPVAGLTSLILIIVILGGLQIFIIGIIGEYISRIFEESKQRPLFIIDKKINF